MKTRVKHLVMISVLPLLLLFNGASVLGADEEQFNSENMLSELERQMKLTREQWEELKPVIEEKSRDLKKGLQESVDKGFAELEKLSNQFESMSKDAERKFNEIATSDEAKKLREYLAKIDKDAIEDIKKKMVADLNALLDLSEEQANKIKPVFEESINELSTMIQGFAKEGSRNWEEFKKDFEKLTKDLYDKVQETLDDEQMKKLEQYNKEQKEKIERVLFKV
ncbi:MAG: hypothetical protein LJE64_01805 [Desulfofustis sp.]|nr:hypothetical protein [Desulfofustis sp.]